ncbi:hypothetical protein VB618_02300 [Microvirga sp. CF3062]|uniref:hypothetical protein n=1 Tax=Microvirga sp. CF3062 TaxID=3110182 RepID=UPI002E77BD26|nr:hypothetical protein [Microvirga sp. CF3062]MEE1655013.1 hypothetical protein [Microvirga sp. CF3062]
MKTIKSGGPAFPVRTESGVQGRASGEQPQQFPGMTLRDYFAAQVMPPMIMDGAALDAIRSISKRTGIDPFAASAEAAYAYADAMLAAREAA